MDELPGSARKKSALSLYSRKKDTANEDNINEGGISTKTFSVQNRRVRSGNVENREKPAAVLSPAKQERSSLDEDDTKPISSSRDAGVNKDLCSLAQSFFDSDKTKKPPPQRRISTTGSIHSKNDTPSPSSTFSGWKSESTQGKHDRRSYPLPPERISFEPKNAIEIVNDEDDLDFPKLNLDHLDQTRLKKNTSNLNSSLPTSNSKGSEIHLKTPSQIYKERSPSTPEDAPPIPERSAQPKMMMLKLMKNATNALKNN
jgi:hypothetical protein